MVAYIIRADVDSNDFVNKLAGADISVKNIDNVIMATITGFSDMPYYNKLVNIALDAIHAVTMLHADDFYSYKRSLSNRIYWQNFNDELEIANDYLRAFVRMQSYDSRRISQEMDYINAATFRETADRILGMTAVRVLINGNVQESVAEILNNRILDALGESAIFTDNQVGNFSDYFFLF